MNSRKDKPIIKEQPATYEDYANLPDDGKRYELADGMLELMSPAPTPKHQAVIFQIHYSLVHSCQEQYIILSSPVDLILSNTEVRQPDILMVHSSRVDIITKRGIEGIPDLVVEVLSPHSVKRDRHNKLNTYARYGIPEYWIVDPANGALEQYLLSEDEERYALHMIYVNEEAVQSDHLPCVSFTMKNIMDAANRLPG